MNSIRKGNIVLEAEPSPEARERLVSTLLRIYRSHTPEQLAALVSRPKPLVLIKGVEEARALKFIEALRTQGVPLQFAPLATSPAAPPEATATPRQPDQQASQAAGSPLQHQPPQAPTEPAASAPVGPDPGQPEARQGPPAPASPGPASAETASPAPARSSEPPPRKFQPPAKSAARKTSAGVVIGRVALLIVLFFLVGFFAAWRLGILSMPKYEPVALNKYDYPEETVSRINVRQLFENREFGKLNELIEKAQRAFENDFHNEFLIHDAAMAFHQPVPEYEDLFREWIALFPDSFQPYLARGNYYWNMGTSSRGAAWAKDTSEKQFTGMQEYFKSAFEDLNHALEINPKLMTAYYAQLAMSNFMGREDLEREYFQRCESICAECYQPRYFYMMALRPKWGGSIKEMEELARQSQQYANKNPLLKTLMGFPYMSMGESSDRRKRHISAMKNYNASLRYGSNFTLLQERADFLMREKKYGLAIKDIDMAIAMRGQVSYAWRTKALIQFGLINYEEALETLKHARELAPASGTVAKTWDWMARSYMEIGLYNAEKQPPVAIRSFKLACEMKPDNAQAHWQLGLMYLKTGEPEKAQGPMERACEMGISEACARL